MQTDTRTTDGEPPRSQSWPLASVIALLPFALLVWRFDWVCDDAFISFRYSRHLAEGTGLRFNPGELPPVEGYSNLLWVLCLAPFEWLGIDLVAAARVLTISCGASLLVLVTRCAERCFQLGFAATLATALFIALLPPVSIWSTGGLETMPFTLALFACYERSLAGARRASAVHAAGICAGLAALLRADGALWAGGILALFLVLPDGRSLGARASVFARALAWLVCFFAAQLLFRLAYHGDWVSNTAHAKAGFSALRLERGVDYVVSFLLTLPALLPIAALALWRSAPGQRSKTLAPLGVLAFALCWALYIGGDFMAMGRLLVPAMPFTALLFAGSLRAPSSTSLSLAWSTAVLATSVLPSFDMHAIPAGLRERFHFRWSSPEPVTEIEQWRTMRMRTAKWETTARALALHTRAGESIVYGAVGSIGYRTELFVHDPLGLVSPEVARSELPPKRASPGHDRRVPPTFFLEREPDYLDAFVVPDSTPVQAGIRPEWRRAAWFERMQLRRIPLDSAQGFAPGTELRLLQLDWTR